MERRQAQHRCRRSIVRRLRRRQTKERIALRRSIDAACDASKEAANRSARIFATANAAAIIRCGVSGVGTVLPGEDGGAYRPLIRPAFAAFVLTASSRERQSHVVGPDGDPQPPGRVGANHARGRRASFHFKNASRSAPHE